MYFVYMIKNSVGKLYIGVTVDPEQRLREHSSGRGAHFTKHIPTYDIIFLEEHQTFAEARKREIQLKRWSRTKKEVLIEKYHQGLPTKI